MSWKLGIYLSFGIFCGAVGWAVNGWRLEARISDLKASYLKDYAEAEKAARTREKQLTEAAAQLRRKKDEQIARINSELWVSLNGLRDRPNRGDLPRDTAPCGAATGAELSRQDAEFLVREAARADAVTLELNYCVAQYNSLRR
jgi:hypothetical protein